MVVLEGRTPTRWEVFQRTWTRIRSERSHTRRGQSDHVCPVSELVHQILTVAQGTKEAVGESDSMVEQENCHNRATGAAWYLAMT